MTLRERLEAHARDAGHPHPETLTPTELLDIIDATKHQHQQPATERPQPHDG